MTGRDHPAELSEGDLIAYCTAGDPANNTVYQRRSKASTFLAWCRRNGVVDHDPAAELLAPSSPLRTYKRTYGTVQAANPGRWLTRDEAYGPLVGACTDGTILGLRDELVIRLGLFGMRVSEIGSLTVAAPSHLPTVTWTGKGRKPRRATTGPAMRDLLRRYLDAYPDPQPSSPLICRQVMGACRQGGAARLDWHQPASSWTLFHAVNDRARAAGRGRVVPHDLGGPRRASCTTPWAPTTATASTCSTSSACSATADPATTMRSYLEPMCTDVLDRAASVLD